MCQEGFLEGSLLPTVTSWRSVARPEVCRDSREGSRLDLQVSPGPASLEILPFSLSKVILICNCENIRQLCTHSNMSIPKIKKRGLIGSNKVSFMIYVMGKMCPKKLEPNDSCLTGTRVQDH